MNNAAESLSQPEGRAGLLGNDAQHCCHSAAIIIPCWNAEKWVARAIQSAIEQDYPNLEIIVIDDGSTDYSLDVIRSFGDRIRWETGPNRGGAAARNRGLALTGAEYVMFLDADDYVEPGSISAWAMKFHSADLVLGPFTHEHAGGKGPTYSPHRSVETLAMLKDWLHGRFTPTCSALWRRAFLQHIGGWNERAIRNQDGELVLRALLQGARVSLAESGLGVYVQHGELGRVSKRAGREVLLNSLELYSDLVRLADSQGIGAARQFFAHAYYGLAYEAFAGRLDDVGDLALGRARALGLRGHVGSPAHRMLSSVLGLRNKLRLTGYLTSRHFRQHAASKR